MVLFERALLWEKDGSQWINYNGSESHQFSLKRLSHLIISFCKTSTACNLNSTFICKQLMIYPCDILHQNWPKCSWEEKLILERGALALDLKSHRVSSKMTISMQKSKKCKKRVCHPLNLKSHIGCARRLCLRLEAKVSTWKPPKMRSPKSHFSIFNLLFIN